MKILQVVHGFPPESVAGTEIYTYNLSRELSRKHEVFIFFRTTDLSRKEYELSFRESEGLKLFSINNTFRNYSSFESTYRDEKVAERFGQVLDKIKPDIVHIQHLLYLSARIIEEVKKRNIPVVFTLNDYWLLCPQGQLFRDNKTVCDSKESAECMDCILYQLGIRKNISFLYAILRKFTPGWFFQAAKNLYLVYAKLAYLSDTQAKKFIDDRMRFMKDLSSQVDLFIAPSEFLRKKFIVFGIPEIKIRCLPYGFDLRPVPRLPKTPSPVLRFGFIGNLMPAKGVHVLIKSFHALPAGTSELRIYGKAFSYKSALGNYVGQLKKMVKGSAVKFMGAFDNLEIGKVLSEIDVLVVPSLWHENAPLVIQEALLSRTPVIASRIGGIPELITDGVNGLLFEPGNEQDLKEKMKSLIRRPSFLDELKQEAFKVKTIREHTQEIEILYKERISSDFHKNKKYGPSKILVETKKEADALCRNSLISVIVPTCGRDAYFVSCLESLRRQTCPPSEVILVNNSLSAELEQKAKEIYPSIKIITPERNLYYGESLNRGIAMSDGDFILCLNDDATLDGDFIREALGGFGADEMIGMVSGKIFRPDRKTLDTTGLFLSASRTVCERGHGRPDRGQFEKDGFIFGVGGAVAFYRRKMLEKIKEGAFFFDPSFRMFYEDLDLAWRARNRGWKAYYVPTALACHVRGGSVRSGSGQGKALARRYLSDEFHRELIKNRYLAIMKNETFGAFCLHLIPIIFYDLCAWGYVLFFRPKVIGIFFSNLKGLSGTIRKKAW